MKYQEDLDKAEKRSEEYDKLYKKLKKRRPKQLDAIIHAHHDEAFETIDCLSCANCCKTTSPIFREVDVKRIAKKFKQSTVGFIDQYLRTDEDGDLVLKAAPCPFLEEGNTCFIYDVRPQACREYPHTDRKRMVQILEETRKNVDICPAVSRITDALSKEFH